MRKSSCESNGNLNLTNINLSNYVVLNMKNNIGVKRTQALVKALNKYGPLIVGINVDNDFKKYSNGIFSYINKKECSKNTNHAVILYGYNSTDNSFLLRNSWSDKWGEKGNFRIDASDCNYNPMNILQIPIGLVFNTKSS